jgi:Flp pilus assembly protein TadD
MKKHMVFLTAIIFLTGITYSQSLGDLAREEQKRRESIPDSTLITNKNTPVGSPKKETPDDRTINEADYAAITAALAAFTANTAQGHLTRGKLYFDMSDDEQAIQELNEAIKLAPNLAEAYAYRAKVNVG